MSQLNLQPLKELDLNEKQIEAILISLTPLLQDLVNQEFDRVLTDEEQDMIESKTDNKPLESLVAYTELYEHKTGKKKKKFSDTKLNELISMAANVYVKQKEYIEKMKGLSPGNLDKFKELIENDDFESADQLLGTT